MKRILVLLLAAGILLSVRSCEKKNETKPQDPVSAPQSNVSEPVAPAPAPTLHLTKEEWPVVDGATAFLPFYQEMAARLLGISTEEAAEYVLCSTTDFAYPYLWQGKVDLIFCLQPSHDQTMEAIKAGVIFEEVPFANEGFVFFVNKENPVDSITVAQLHDIYAGKITNWKELGGKDEKILAYQRTEGSGSQTGLYKHIISPSEIQEPPMEKRIGSMYEIVDAVAGYKNAAGAIGYSYRYFVTNMHYDNQIKMLKVEGIYPDSDTIADGTYPLISDVCAVFRADEPEESAVRRIADWCRSPEGAALAKELGYVPRAAAETPYVYKADRSDEAVIDYAKGNPSPVCTVMNTYYENNLTIENVYLEDGTYPKISGLKDKSVQNAINKKIVDTYQELLAADYPAYPGVRMRLAMFTEEDEQYPYDACVSGSFNNMLSVVFRKVQSRYHYEETGTSDYLEMMDIRTLNLDLNTGKEIYIGDLFVDDMDGVAYINDLITAQSHKPEAFDEPPRYSMDRSTNIYFRRAFEGINTNQKFYLSGDSGDLCIVLDYKNPEIANYFVPTIFQIDMQGINAYESRFMNGTSLFEDETKNPCLFYHITNDDDFIDGEDYNEEWSEGRRLVLNSFITYDASLKDIMEKTIMSDERFSELKRDIEFRYDTYRNQGISGLNGFVDVSLYANICGRYINTHSSIYVELRHDDTALMERSSEEEHLCFDADSREPIAMAACFVPGCDVDAIMRKVIIGNLRDTFQTKYSEDTYEAIFTEVMPNLNGFSVGGNALKLYYSNADDIICSYISEGNTYFDVERRRTALCSLLYKDIGVENLVIFD